MAKDDMQPDLHDDNTMSQEDMEDMERTIADGDKDMSTENKSM